MQLWSITYSLLLFILFVIFVTLSALMVKRKSHLLLIISIVLLIAVSMSVGALHFGPSIFIKHELKNLQTTFSKDGICKQTTGFTCGPAAAVTVLRHLGIDAQESDLAVSAKCTPEGGTTNELLVNAIEKLYGKKGIKCTIQSYDSIDQLKESSPLIACIKLSSVISHYTVVLEVTEDKVIIGDPIGGKKEWSYEDFHKRCWPDAIILKRNKAQLN